MRVSVEIAAAADDEAIRGLLKRQPIPGRVTLAFEREPSFAIGCAVTGENPVVLVARSDDRQVVGVACRSVRHVYVNGRPERIGYLGQLRIDERFRGRWLVSRGFAQLAEIDRSDPLPAYLVSIAEGSDEAREVLVRKRRASFPEFHDVAEYHTLALSLHRARTSRADRDDMVPGSIEQIPEIVEFLRAEGARRQLFPVWSVAMLRDLERVGLGIGDFRIARRGARIAGVMGLWDQSAYKQSVIRDYAGWLKVASWLGGSIVPRVGDHVRSAYAALVGIANDDATVFRQLLGEVSAAAAARGFQYLIVGLDA
ncbi:MAG TPA: hypothetical protein VL919_13025, partial [Vicinamibacterales bacterium]|nr:hypothetical protein [Vicinamibacterales bacterium]